MKISTKGQYALEAVVDLALNAKAEHENLQNIAERRNLSKNYLEQIFSSLRREGVVESIRGPQGGYKLKREPKSVTVGEIVRAVEGSLAPVACIADDKDKVDCLRYNECVTRLLWTKIMNVTNNELDAITIQDLLDCHSRYTKEDAIEYFI